MAKESKREKRLRRTAEAYNNRANRALTAGNNAGYLRNMANYAATNEQRARVGRALMNNLIRGDVVLNASGPSIREVNQSTTGVYRRAARAAEVGQTQGKRSTVKTGFGRLGQVEKNVARRKSMGGSGG